MAVGLLAKAGQLVRSHAFQLEDLAIGSIKLHPYQPLGGLGVDIDGDAAIGMSLRGIQSNDIGNLWRVSGSQGGLRLAAVQAPVLIGISQLDRHEVRVGDVAGQVVVDDLIGPIQDPAKDVLGGRVVHHFGIHDAPYRLGIALVSVRLSLLARMTFCMADVGHVDGIILIGISGNHRRNRCQSFDHQNVLAHRHDIRHVHRAARFAIAARLEG